MKIQVILTIIITALECVAYGGTLYGWSSLQPVLIAEGFFADDRCNSTTNTTDKFGCSYQTEQLSLVFTIASSVAPILSPVFGYCMDHYGNWLTRSVIFFVILSGLLTTAAATPASSWVLFLSFSLCNFASYGLIISNAAIGNLCPDFRSLIVTLMSGSFDSATVLFLIFRKLYGYGVSFQTMFYLHAVCIVFFMIHTFCLTPKRTAPYVLPPDYKYGYKEIKLCHKYISSPEIGGTANDKHCYDHEDNPDKRSLKSCFKKMYTWTALIHFGVSSLAVTNFIDSFHTWIITAVHKNSIEMYTSIFGIAQGLGIFIAPINGLLIDYLRRKYRTTDGLHLASFKSVTLMLFISDFIVISMIVCSLIPLAEMQFVTIILQVVGRSFVCATGAAFVNAVYPTQHFGVIYGLTLAAGGAFLLLQYPMTLLITRVFDNNFQTLNFVMVALCFTNLLHPIYLMNIIKSKEAIIKINHIKKW